MFAKINTLGLYGLNAFPVYAEVDISIGTPVFEIVGLPDMVVRESRERIKSAMRSAGIKFPNARVMVNLAPADTKKSGSVHDIAILMAVLKAMDFLTGMTDDCCFIGEVSLNGDVRGVNGVLPMTLTARKNGIKNIFVPADNAFEASVVDEIHVYGVKSIMDVIRHFTDGGKIPVQAKYIASGATYNDILDFRDVKGQHSAKLALEIAAAGGHNALLIGSPGSGKSMLAKRMPSILPLMTFQESIETTNIHSISGLLQKDTPLITKRPFRSPHHTISSAGLAGGGSIPHPGEISLAHNGLLFLDELAEFDRRTLEILRQPLEDQKVTISRSAGTITYPSSIMLIAAMNPCPCGFFGHPKKKCICSQKQVANYLSKISGPLLDRLDLHIEVEPAEFESLTSSKEEECSADIRKRIQAAREIQLERFRGTDITCNARITAGKLRRYCPLNDSANAILSNVFDKMGLSARAYDRILKVARTIADLDKKEVINKTHIAQAVQYRSLDRKYWSQGGA
ncbi:MAG: YifB family Mg chelatase-like AAA ATPase [Oscillospiraceae bacterium]|nr:YifB family Mg chelatase-like AAA ATPase [Oscillospiraceae bacterium]